MIKFYLTILINNNRLNMSSAARHVFQQFKNAQHASRNLGESSSFKLEFSPHKGGKKEGEGHVHASLFGLSNISRHFKDMEQINNKSRSSLEGLGITVDDYGHLIIAEWRNNQIDGRYFLFKPNLIDEGDHNNIYSAVCQYGFMKAGNLEGENYVYNISGTLARGEFQQNKINGKCFIIHSNKLFIANQLNQMDKVQCEVVNFAEKESEVRKKENSNVLMIPKISSMSQKEGKSIEGSKFPSNFEQVEVNIFVKPNQFLEELIKQYQNKERNSESLAYVELNEREYFVGFLQNQKKPQKQGFSKGKSESKVNGFGAIFKNEWPASYGSYKSGHLQGLGRIYETQMNLYDGFFANGELIQGFIIDYYANTTSFGHHSAIDPEYKAERSQQDCFIITNTFQTVSSEYIIEYKKNFHLKSLNFNNSYFNSPKLIHRSPWPYNIVNKLNKRTHIETLIKSFKPSLRDMEISQIEKMGQSTENRLEKELIKEIKESKLSFQEEESKSSLLKQKSNYIKDQISKNLMEKQQRQDEKNTQKVFSKYINEYKRLQRKKTEIIQSKHNKSKSKKEESLTFQILDQSQTGSSKSHQLMMTPTKKHQEGPKNNQKEDLSFLVNQYNQCQTERKNSISGNTTRRNNTDRKVSPRELLSKRSLIQQDHNHFMGKQKLNKTPKITNTRRKVDLDLIYQQYLHK